MPIIINGIAVVVPGKQASLTHSRVVYSRDWRSQIIWPAPDGGFCSAPFHWRWTTSLSQSSQPVKNDKEFRLRNNVILFGSSPPPDDTKSHDLLSPHHHNCNVTLNLFCLQVNTPVLSLRAPDGRFKASAWIYFPPAAADRLMRVFCERRERRREEIRRRTPPSSLRAPLYYSFVLYLLHRATQMNFTCRVGAGKWNRTNVRARGEKPAARIREGDGVKRVTRRGRSLETGSEVVGSAVSCWECSTASVCVYVNTKAVLWTWLHTILYTIVCVCVCTSIFVRTWESHLLVGTFSEVRTVQDKCVNFFCKSEESGFSDLTEV